MDSSEQVRKIWMPITKNVDGSYSAILSDESIDRDDELMSKELLIDWAKNKSLPMLANHKNEMQSWLGGWRQLKVLEKKGKNALYAKPFFFSKDANPLAGQIQKQLDEALSFGLNAGVSIGAIPKESREVEIKGKMFNQWIKAELVEASIVPVQSNRNASYGHIAKQFSIESNYNKNVEGIKMSDEPIKDPVPEPKPVPEPAPEPVPEPEPKPEPKPEPVSDEAKDKISELTKQVQDLKKQVEKSVVVKPKLKLEPDSVPTKTSFKDVEPTVTNMLCAIKGFKIEE